MLIKNLKHCRTIFCYVMLFEFEAAFLVITKKKRKYGAMLFQYSGFMDTDHIYRIKIVKTVIPGSILVSQEGFKV